MDRCYSTLYRRHSDQLASYPSYCHTQRQATTPSNSAATIVMLQPPTLCLQLLQRMLAKPTTCQCSHPLTSVYIFKKPASSTPSQTSLTTPEAQILPEVPEPHHFDHTHKVHTSHHSTDSTFIISWKTKHKKKAESLSLWLNSMQGCKPEMQTWCKQSDKIGSDQVAAQSVVAVGWQLQVYLHCFLFATSIGNMHIAHGVDTDWEIMGLTVWPRTSHRMVWLTTSADDNWHWHWQTINNSRSKPNSEVWNFYSLKAQVISLRTLQVHPELCLPLSDSAQQRKARQTGHSCWLEWVIVVESNQTARLKINMSFRIHFANIAS